MKRVLFLLPSAPEPADSGARLRNRCLLRLAAERYTRRDARLRTARAASGRDSQRVQQLRTASAGCGRSATRPRSFAAKVRCAFASGDHLAVQAEGIEMAQYLGLIPPERRIYDAHNAEFLLQRRASETATSLVGRASTLGSSGGGSNASNATSCAPAGCTLAVSEHDANQLMALVGWRC